MAKNSWICSQQMNHQDQDVPQNHKNFHDVANYQSLGAERRYDVCDVIDVDFVAEDKPQLTKHQSDLRQKEKKKQHTIVPVADICDDDDDDF